MMTQLILKKRQEISSAKFLWISDFEICSKIIETIENEKAPVEFSWSTVNNSMNFLTELCHDDSEKEIRNRQEIWRKKSCGGK